jgi:hypothetical protein
MVATRYWSDSPLRLDVAVDVNYAEREEDDAREAVRRCKRAGERQSR